MLGLVWALSHPETISFANFTLSSPYGQDSARNGKSDMVKPKIIAVINSLIVYSTIYNQLTDFARVGYLTGGG